MSEKTTENLLEVIYRPLEEHPDNYLENRFEKGHWKLINGKPIPKQGSVACKILETISPSEKRKFENSIFLKLKKCSGRKISRRRIVF